MKNTYFIFILVSAFLFIDCSNSDDSNANDSEEISITLFQIAQTQNIITFTYDADIEASQFQLSYQLSEAQTLPNQGTIINLPPNSPKTFSLGNLNIYEEGTYVFYLKATSINGVDSNWSQPQLFNVSNFCLAPDYLTGVYYDTELLGLQWGNAVYNIDIEGYEVRYGLQGFDISNNDLGTNIITSEFSTYDFDFSDNETYDFYVRTLCSNEFEYSEWIGSFTETYEAPYCPFPTGLNAYVEYSEGPNGGSTVPVSIFYSFNDIDVSRKLRVVLTGDDVDQGEVVYESFSESTLNYYDTFGWISGTYLIVGQSYDIYIRHECTPDNVSEWTEPITIIWQ